jgi:hypothetical protein
MIGSTMNETPCSAQQTFGFQRKKRCVNHNAMESRVNASQMPRYREFRWSMIRTSGHRFSLATKTERVRAEIMP